MAKAKKRTKKELGADKKLLERIRKRFKVMSDADDTNRQQAMDDLRFANVPGEQWDENMRKLRGNRPCYEFNKCRINGKKVINEMRANRPSGKVRAVEGGDKETAELYEGLIRNIWNTSDGDTVIDNAAEYQVDAGMGAWRLDTEYSSDSAFDQDICIRTIKNPFCLYVDPSCQDVMKRDANDWILTEKLSKDAFEAKYPDAERVDFDDVDFDDDDDWESEESVRIAEYWYKQRDTKELWLVEVPSDEPVVEGQEPRTKEIVIDSTTDEGMALAGKPGFEQMIKRRREVKYDKIMSCIVSGDSVLGQPSEWAGNQFPFVMIYGEFKVIDGKQIWWGLHRFAKDAQRSYNVSRTATDESIASASKSKVWATTDQAKGLVDQWTRAHNENLAFQLYNADPKAPGPPVRIGGADVPVAMIQQSAIAAQDIRDTTGLHEASFGEESNEKSGIALARKQNQAQVVTYNFPDNQAKGIRRTWELLIDLIPNVYDAEREIRVIGADGEEDYRTINQIVTDEDGTEIRVNDLSAGRYDVVVDTGPSFQTLRQEASEMYSQLAQSDEMLMPTAADLVYKSLDLPYAAEIAKRRAAMLPPQIQQMLADGKDIPPEAQAVMAQAEQMMAQVQEHSQLVQAAAKEVEDDAQATEKDKAAVEKTIARLEVLQANFDAAVAKELAEITKRIAALDVREAQVQGEQDDRAELEQVKGMSEAANEAIASIDQMVATFMEAASAAMDDLNVKVSTPKPKVTNARIRRENGQAIAEMEYDDGTVKRMAANRQNGELVATPID